VPCTENARPPRQPHPSPKSELPAAATAACRQRRCRPLCGDLGNTGRRHCRPPPPRPPPAANPWQCRTPPPRRPPAASLWPPSTTARHRRCGERGNTGRRHFQPPPPHPPPAKNLWPPSKTALHHRCDDGGTRYTVMSPSASALAAAEQPSRGGRRGRRYPSALVGNAGWCSTASCCMLPPPTILTNANGKQYAAMPRLGACGCSACHGAREWRRHDGHDGRTP